jgi:hypothetical protein
LTIADAPPQPAPPRGIAADWAYLLGFIAANLALKFAIVPLNRGEYTDGILQLLVFQVPAKLYPPLFGALAHLVSMAGPGLETAGRLVSAVAGALAVIPVYAMALRLRGGSAARFAALFFTVSPMVLRWSGHAMTDSLFFALCATSMALAVDAWARVREGEPRGAADLRLAGAVLCGALASLTRYQGAFLAVVIAVPLLAHIRRHRALPVAATLAGLAWLALPAWIMHHGFAHARQFSDRSANQWITTLLDYLNLAESFVYIAPYYFALPVVAFALVGLLKCDRGRPYTRAFLVLWAVWGIIVLFLQSAFQSFQYRYMMPVLPAVLALAGAGCAVAEDWLVSKGRRWAFSALFGASMAYLAVFSCAVLVFQRETFGDQREAARLVRDRFPGAAVFSNEQYGEFHNIECVKMAFWSGTRVRNIRPYLSRDGDRRPGVYFPPGAVVILSNAYGGDMVVDQLCSQFNLYYHMRNVGAYSSTVIPVLDDVMVNPMFNQNPMAWVLRYKPQLFSTHIFVMDRQRTPAELDDLMRRGLVPPAGDADAATTATSATLEAVRQ